MRNANRTYPFCCHLAELWAKYCPDWRFAQLIDNIRAYYQSDLFYNEDEQFMYKVEHYFYAVLDADPTSFQYYHPEKENK
jgi:hypothetical protein